MALFAQMSRERRREEGMQFLMLVFLVPVWVKLTYVDEFEDFAPMFGQDGKLLPKMRAANWVPEPLRWLAAGMLGFWMYFTDSIFNEPGMPIVYLWADDELLREQGFDHD